MLWVNSKPAPSTPEDPAAEPSTPTAPRTARSDSPSPPASSASATAENVEPAAPAPKRPIEVRMMWFAGFFDGEGAAGITRTKRKGRASTYYPRLTITNTNRYALECIKHTFGGSISKHDGKLARTKGWRRSYQWSLGGDAAYRLALKLRRWCLVKQPALELFIRFCRYRERREASLITMAAMKRRLHTVNKRGVR